MAPLLVRRRLLVLWWRTWRRRVGQVSRWWPGWVRCGAKRLLQRGVDHTPLPDAKIECLRQRQTREACVVRNAPKCSNHSSYCMRSSYHGLKNIWMGLRKISCLACRNQRLIYFSCSAFLVHRRPLWYWYNCGTHRDHSSDYTKLHRS